MDTNRPLNGENSPTELKQGKNTLNLDQCLTYLDKLPARTKVKVKIEDFESFRQFLPLVNKYIKKFEVFKYETDFKVASPNIQKSVLSETTSFKEAFIKWLKQQTIDVKVKEILLKEIE